MLNQIIKFQVKPEHLQQFAEALLINKNNTMNEPGNIEIKIFNDKQDPSLFFAYERWENQAALDLHKQQSYTKNLIQLTATLLNKPVEVLSLGETAPFPVPLKKANPKDELFIIFFIFKIKKEMRKQLLTQFEKHITHTRQEEANLLFDLFTVDGDDTTLAVYEHWRNESAVWDIHFKQPYSLVTGSLMEQAVVGDMKQYMNFVTEIN